MGSTGSGTFSDYQSYGSKKPNESNQGGTGVIDQCSIAFSTNLEEVSNCEYFKINNAVPSENASVIIVFDVRLIVKTKEGISLGYLPTKYNYLRACMEDGYGYKGIIASTSLTPIPQITIDVAPDEA